ncbi:MAG: hypothetical protein IK093_19065 [Ruminiclostridium sp.]|nr:hypothetical protein [Ruminiclostridium sp.]
MKGTVKQISEVSAQDIDAMFALMDEFYENMDRAVFERDFFAKDYCIILRNDEDRLVGFTTQKVMSVNVDGKEVHGMFSGDTIIHKDYWGDTELFRVWAQFWFPFAERYDEFWWFLICKGYKTYRILPLFWREFFPSYKAETPAYEKKIIDAYAKLLYPDEYDPATGVIEYKHVKDRLRAGVADIDEHRMKNKDVEFFSAANPHHADGNDIACLARIDRSLLRKRAPALLFE